MLSSHRPPRRHKQRTIGYQSGPSPIVFVFMSGILVPQSCLFFDEFPHDSLYYKGRSEWL